MNNIFFIIPQRKGNLGFLSISISEGLKRLKSNLPVPMELLLTSSTKPPNKPVSWEQEGSKGNLGFLSFNFFFYP